MGGGHEEFKPTKYHSIHDIPDSLVKTYSVRQPDNPFYKTRQWVNFKKTQILFSQMDGVPGYLRTKCARFNYFVALYGSIALAIYNIYSLNKHLNKKK